MAMATARAHFKVACWEAEHEEPWWTFFLRHTIQATSQRLFRLPRSFLTHIHDILVVGTGIASLGAMDRIGDRRMHAGSVSSRVSLDVYTLHCPLEELEEVQIPVF
eukprot:2984464-Amphidinium_carterae.1